MVRHCIQNLLAQLIRTHRSRVDMIGQQHTVCIDLGGPHPFWPPFRSITFSLTASNGFCQIFNIGWIVAVLLVCYRWLGSFFIGFQRHLSGQNFHNLIFLCGSHFIFSSRKYQREKQFKPEMMARLNNSIIIFIFIIISIIITVVKIVPSNVELYKRKELNYKKQTTAASNWEATKRNEMNKTRIERNAV